MTNSDGGEVSNLARLHEGVLTVFREMVADRDRLMEALSTIRINAMQVTPESRGAFISFCDMGLCEVLAGATATQAYKTWNAYQKCASCGAAAGALEHDLCPSCAATPNTSEVQ